MHRRSTPGHEQHPFLLLQMPAYKILGEKGVAYKQVKLKPPILVMKALLIALSNLVIFKKNLCPCTYAHICRATFCNHLFLKFYLSSLPQIKASSLQTIQQIWGEDVRKKLRRLSDNQIHQQQDSRLLKMKTWQIWLLDLQQYYCRLR